MMGNLIYVERVQEATLYFFSVYLPHRLGNVKNEGICHQSQQ